MPAAPLIVTAMVSLCTVVGTLQLAFGDVAEPLPALVAGAGMVLVTIVAASGTLLARGRWAAPTDAAVAVTWMGIAVATPFHPLTVGLLSIGAATLAASTGPWLRGWLRRLPRADGPPPAAVVLLLSLLATTPVTALASPRGLAIPALVVCAWSPLLALGLARLVPGVLAGSRVVNPALVIAAAAATGLPGGAFIAAIGAVATAAAWRRDLRLAVVPAVSVRGSAVSIPPELAPPEILEAAGLDERGYPRRES